MIFIYVYICFLSWHGKYQQTFYCIPKLLGSLINTPRTQNDMVYIYNVAPVVSWFINP